MNNNLIPLKKLPPFINFCCTIGGTPTSYINSLTYEEQLLWLCQYLEKTVIPAINNNANAVAELQALYETLKSYVDNYFENLNVQNEINNKLDQMVTDGTFDNILNQELLSDINNKVDNIFNIQNENFIGGTLIIGDSYSVSTVDNVWTNTFKNLINCPDDMFFNLSRDGYGFTKGDFHRILNNAISTISNPDIIRNIIVVGGCNEINANYTSILSKAQTFLLSATNHFPNARVFVGMIGTINYQNGQEARFKLKSDVLQAYQDCVKNIPRCHYLNNIQYVFQNSVLIQNDGIHPTQEGQDRLAENIYQTLLTGTTNISYSEYHDTISAFYPSNISSDITIYINNNMCFLTNSNIIINFTEPVSFTNSIYLGSLKSNLIDTCLEHYNDTYCNITCYDNQNNILFNGSGILYITYMSNNHNILQLHNFNNTQNITNISRLDVYPTTMIMDYHSI